MKTHYRKNSFLPVTAALALLLNHATAATFTWTGATSNFWTVAASWDTGTTPAAANTTDVIISGTTNVGNMSTGTLSPTVRSLTFDGTNDANTSLTLQRTGNNGSGSTQLTFSSDSGNATLTVAADSTGDKTLNRGGGFSNILLTSSLDIVQNGSGNLTFGSQINTTGAGGINKSGTGTLLLAGSNTYTGATNITTGTLALGHATDTLSSSSAVTVDGATAVLSIAGNSDTVGAVSLKNGGSITGSVGTLTGASYALESGSVSAILGGAGIALTKSTAGTVTLSGTNTYTGTTTIQNGTLALDGAANRLATTAAVVLGDPGTTGKLVLGGTTTAGQTLTSLTTTGLGGSVVGGNAANSMLTLNIASSNTFDGTLGGAGTNENNLTLAKTSAGSLTLTGNNTFSGGISIPANGGTVIAGHNNALGTASVSLNSNTALQIQNGITINNSLRAEDQGNFKGLTLLSGATSATYSGNISILETTPTNFDINAANGGTFTISGIISGNGFEKVGVGTVILTAANTYTGNTTVSAGTLALADNAQLSFVLGATSGTNNSLSGAGAVTLEGDFVIVTTAADALASGTWTIENVSTLTGAYGANFTVSGFSDAGSDKWTKVNGSKTYTFDETTGILTLAETPVAGYSAWATLNGAGVNFNEDHDNDGVDNGTEYFIGGTAGNTTGFTPLPGVANTLGVLSVTYTKAATYTGVYGTDYVVETSSTLADPWAPQLADPTPDFTVTFPNATEVKYTFPAGTKQFARLKVIQTP